MMSWCCWIAIARPRSRAGALFSSTCAAGVAPDDVRQGEASKQAPRRGEGADCNEQLLVASSHRRTHRRRHGGRLWCWCWACTVHARAACDDSLTGEVRRYGSEADAVEEVPRRGSNLIALCLHLSSVACPSLRAFSCQSLTCKQVVSRGLSLRAWAGRQPVRRRQGTSPNAGQTCGHHKSQGVVHTCKFH